VGEPIRQTRAELLAQRPAGAAADDHFCESFAAAVVERYSRPGDLVVDPFAGNGTTPAVAARAGRRTWATEIDPERADLARRRSGPAAEIVTADIRAMGPADLPSEVALILTSPPYMTATDHPENPLTGYRTHDGDYHRYLAELGSVIARLTDTLLPGGHLVVNVADPVDEGHPATPLVHDFRRLVDDGPLLLVDTHELQWDEPPEGIVHDTCLVYQR
jgi:DNA modification methylase